MTKKKESKSTKTDTSTKPTKRKAEEASETSEQVSSALSDAESALLDDGDVFLDEPDDASSLDEVDEPSPVELEEIEEEELTDDAEEPPPVSDDPVRQYLREIGQVPLLEPHQEIWLATQREVGVYLGGLRARLIKEDGGGQGKGGEGNSSLFVEFTSRDVVGRTQELQTSKAARA